MSTPQPNPIDIRASADQVIGRMQQPTVVQEALDRYVAAGAQEQLTRHGDGADAATGSSLGWTSAQHMV